MKNITAVLAGLVFGLGIALSGMANPAKVLNFFDVFGTFDPSLAVVMGSALATALIGYRLVFGARQTPQYEPAFSLPTQRNIDLPLVGGSALFGVGWGIAGFCPGGAIPTLGFGGAPTFTFVGAMVVFILLAGFAIYLVNQLSSSTAAINAANKRAIDANTANELNRKDAVDAKGKLVEKDRDARFRNADEVLGFLSRKFYQAEAALH